MKRTCRRGLIVLLLIAGLGCAGARMQQAWQAVAAAEQDCQAQLVVGTLRSQTDAAVCTNVQARRILADAKYPHMDVQDALQAARLSLAAEVDRGAITPAEARTRFVVAKRLATEILEIREQQAAERRAAILMAIGVTLRQMGQDLQQGAPPPPAPPPPGLYQSPTVQCRTRGLPGGQRETVCQ